MDFFKKGTETINNLFIDTSPNICNLNNNKLLEINNILYATLKNINIDIPNLVVVGTQSSGKSSVLNSLIGMDILPTGKEMVTRTPLQLEMIFHPDDYTLVEFGEYRHGEWVSHNKQKISYPRPTEIEKCLIYEYIESETCQKAGDQKDISDNPIYLKIKSNQVSNLSLIDLPGLTSIACTDKGQPIDIKQKIERLITKYIKLPSCLILAVLPARSDLETDMSLALIKKYDPKYERCIGVLTKIDLMNDPSDIIKYLNNSISKDLQLKHGYFVLKNRNNMEKDRYSVSEAIKLEQNYFKNISEFNSITHLNRLGIKHFKNYLIDILLTQIKQYLPKIDTEVNTKINMLTDKLSMLGNEVPTTYHEKCHFINDLLLNFSKNLDLSINSKGYYPEIQYSSKIKNSLVTFRQDLTKRNRFIMTELETNSKPKIINIIDNCQGNHMTFPYPNIEILESCLKDNELNLIKSLETTAFRINHEITTLLIDAINVLITKYIARFPSIKDKLTTKCIEEIILPNSETSKNQIKLFIQMQINYIWTDNLEFKEILKQFATTSNNDNLIDILKRLLNKYMECIIIHLQDIIPKSIMFLLVDKTVKDIFYHKLLVIDETNIDCLLLENHNLHESKDILTKQYNQLIMSKKIINKYLT